ncbi:MAG: tRNA pseudouridine(55) synthase TruB [Spirochaetales bacterium]|jgi:tRNA pseudouridine55 synthase
MTASGYLLFDKPAGKTSFAALSGLKKTFPNARIGHTGTLDSFATGLLIVVLGTYSRLASWFVGLDKVYEAEIRFGIGTDTLDPCGAVTGTGPIPSREALEAALPAFRGEILQIPPDYSAIHVEGKRASSLVRKGGSISLPARPVTIFSLEVSNFADGLASMTIHCSSGTYVRALARDIAAACGTCAHVSALRRVKVGPFSVRDAIASPEDAAAQAFRSLDPEAAALLGLEIASVPAEHEAAFSNGAPYVIPAIIRYEASTTGMAHGADIASGADIAVFSSRRTFLGILENRSGRLSYKHVMPKGELD